ncbi:MAG: HAD family hydrolase [Bdellovibrionaceae bacterium]|nr:HAD family hydrolase [Pseudobdellovibrionaceae bacterium]
MSLTPWKEASLETLSQIDGICFDIDDTFSTDGKILPETYQSLWSLKASGFQLVAVTGRPAGWCDHIARFWPVDAVVGENGAFTFFMNQGKRERLDTPQVLSLEEMRKKLNQLKIDLLYQWKDLSFASDQPYREYDLAIDFCEDVPPWTSDEVQKLVKFCESKGAIAKVSSIHVNTWFGSFEKSKGFEYWLEQTQKEEKRSKERWLYIGDSPNDEPMFNVFQWSVAVSNIQPFLKQIKKYPQWITQEYSGKGFVEMSERMILSRGEK